MKSIDEILKNKSKSNNNVNIVNSISNNNVTNDTVHNSMYALDENKFKLNTPKTQTAYNMAVVTEDLKNYACYLKIVNDIGVEAGERLLRVFKDHLRQKANTATPVRSKPKYFMYLYHNKRY